MAAIKVLHLIPTLSSGGAERQLVNLVTNTSREKINHTVCVIGDSGFFGPNILKAGYKVVELGISAKRPFLKAASKFRRIVREINPDIIHSWLYDANVSTRLAMIGNGKLSIITSLQLPDYDPEVARIGNYNKAKVFGLRSIDKLTARIARPYFVSCSEYVQKSYEKYYGIDKKNACVIYNSVDPEWLRVSAGGLKTLREELALPPETFIYLNVGRLDPQKNHEVLFQAFRLVINEAPNAFLLLAGVGGLEDRLKERARELKISEKVLFLGRRSDIGALLELADVFVFPSFYEGLPVALVEAMFKSLPCVASRIDVFKEVITDGETGLLIDPNSSDELKNAMIKLHRSESLRTFLGKNALDKAAAKFSASKTAKQWEKLYTKLAGETNV